MENFSQNKSVCMGEMHLYVDVHVHKRFSGPLLETLAK